jgi:hypothetical protein
MHPLLVALVALVAVGRAPVAAKQPPNIVLMLIDDCKPDLVVVLAFLLSMPGSHPPAPRCLDGHTDIGYHNEKYDSLLRTPNLDALAADGIKLENCESVSDDPRRTGGGYHVITLQSAAQARGQRRGAGRANA